MVPLLYDMNLETIFMPPQNEGTEVWVPIVAERISQAEFRITGPMPDYQDWVFTPGERVAVKQKIFSDGSTGLAATGLCA